MIVYTTVLGRTYPLQEPECKSDWRFVCFTDQQISAKRWELIPVLPTQTPSRLCRRFKIRPHRVFPKAEITLWQDNRITLKTPPEVIAARYQGEFVAFDHGRRSRITDEAAAILAARKARRADIMNQLATYQAAGFDADDDPQTVIHHGGMLLRRHTPKVIEHAEVWHREVQTRTLRDQMSLDYTAKQVGLTIQQFEGVMESNDLCQIHHHPHYYVNDY